MATVQSVLKSVTPQNFNISPNITFNFRDPFVMPPSYAPMPVTPASSRALVTRSPGALVPARTNVGAMWNRLQKTIAGGRKFFKMYNHTN
jgi:hypothetical protein